MTILSSVGAGHRQLSFPIPEGTLNAELWWPENPWGVIVFAHGSGSNRHSPRNRKMAEFFYQAGLASLLLDLLLSEESSADSGMLIGLDRFSERFGQASCWLQQFSGALPLGFYGASTGAAVALQASLQGQVSAQAVVSRGGRPDLLGADLRQVRTPCLFLVGERDLQVRAWNQSALEALPLSTPCQLQVIPGAGHLFEGPGELERVAELSVEWYRRFMAKSPAD